MTIQFPHVPEDISADWLNKMLCGPGMPLAGGSLAMPEVVQLAGGFGQTSETVRLRVADPAAEGGIRTFVVKTASRDEHRRELMQEMNAYRAEVNFYQQISGRIGTRVPFCYIGEVDERGEFFILILEDFPDHRPGDEVVGLAPDDAGLAVSQLAHLHGPLWNDAAAAATVRELHADPAELPPALLASGWETMASTFGEFIPDGVLEFRDRYFAAAPRLHRWVAGADTTVAHGDFRLDNLLFGGSGASAGDRLVVLDWQGVCVSKGIRDHTYLITHSMSVSDRRECETSLLHQYVDALSAHGVRYDFDQALLDYKLAMLDLIQIVVWITGIHVNPHERAFRRKRALVERAFTSILDHEAFDLLESV